MGSCQTVRVQYHLGGLIDVHKIVGFMLPYSPTRRSSGTRPEAGEPLNFTLGAMRIMPIFSVLRGVDSAACFVASSVLVASSLVAELLVLPVRLFSRTVSFVVLRSSLLRSLLRHASSAFSYGGFSSFYLQRSVAMLASNPALKRDAAKARRPLAPR